MRSRVILVGYDGAEALDLFGPANVFSGARERAGSPVYDIIVAAVGQRTIRLTCGTSVVVRDLVELRPRPSDTVLVAGGADAAIAVMTANKSLTRWLVRAASVVRRIGSVCDGAFILANAGLVDGHIIATHWSSCDRLMQRHPRVRVDREAIFVRDRRVWTSAGVSTGIDMALAIVEEDLGRRLADSVAAHLVLYVRRPGFQSQFSEALVAQTAASDPLGPVVMYVRENLRAPIDVARLARSAGMSVRSLHRHCLQVLHTTPAKLVEKLRVEHARTLLTTTHLGTKMIAARCGFGSAPRMARAFERTLGVAPSAYRMMFSPPVAPAAA
jgi:transcriptional regulator GlxA family with amidase domain